MFSNSIFWLLIVLTAVFGVLVWYFDKFLRGGACKRCLNFSCAMNKTPKAIHKKFFQKRKDIPSQTLLVIDDDRSLLRLLKTNFMRHGISVLTAETGESGLWIAEQHKPDLIILDVILPKMKGRAVCAKLKENPLTKEIPVIFLTAKNSRDDVHAEMEAGALAHIT